MIGKVFRAIDKSEDFHDTLHFVQIADDSLDGLQHGAGRDDVIRKMKEYKAGTRPGTIMPHLAKGYTEAQIQLIAGWFAAQKPAK